MLNVIQLPTILLVHNYVTITLKVGEKDLKAVDSS